MKPVLILMIAFAFFSISSFVSCSASSVKLTGDTRKPVSTREVREYASIPLHAQKIGTITVSDVSYYKGMELKRRIRRKAAEAGANGYMMTYFGKNSQNNLRSNGPVSNFYIGEAVLFVVP